jgi:DNA-directed RNA polymerase subunit RPC12/RpoP
MSDVKILLYDLETLPMITATFSLYPDSIGHDNILSDWSIISACWKELNDPTIHSSSIIDDPEAFKADVNNDYIVVKTLRDAFEDADIIIGHNSKKFDTKKLNARLIFWGLAPLPSGLQQVDTLLEVRKVAAFSSNRLDYLGKHLLGEGKMETSKGLWLRVLKGDKTAVEEMVVYNKEDVRLLEDLYLKLLPYIKSHPNISDPDTNNCPKCNSTKIVKDGVRLRASGARYQSYKCNDCGSNFSDTKTLVKPVNKL